MALLVKENGKLKEISPVSGDVLTTDDLKANLSDLCEQLPMRGLRQDLLPPIYRNIGLEIALVDEDAQYKDCHLNLLGTFLTGISIIGDLLLVTRHEMGEDIPDEPNKCEHCEKDLTDNKLISTANGLFCGMDCIYAWMKAEETRIGNDAVVDTISQECALDDCGDCPIPSDGTCRCNCHSCEECGEWINYCDAVCEVGGLKQNAHDEFHGRTDKRQN